MIRISVLIPVYNERAFVDRDLPKLLEWLDETYGKHYELVIVENGSTDGTYEALQASAQKNNMLKIYTLSEASFGNAVRTAILEAKGETGVLLNADWLDKDFITQGVNRCQTSDVVIGSKLLDPSLDHRPIFRKIASRLLTLLLQKSFSFHFSDSHGLKAFRLAAIKPIIKVCSLNEVIESELLLRAQKANLKIVEIPVAISEIRAPRISFVRRIYSMFRELISLRSIVKKMAK